MAKSNATLHVYLPRGILLESLWARITEIHRIAAVAKQPIEDHAVIALVLPIFEHTGLFLHAVELGTHFMRANKLHFANLTAADLNYTDANIATTANSPISLSCCDTPTQQQHWFYY